VIAKPLAGGKVGFYFNVRTYFRKLGCSIPNAPLGTDYTRACSLDGNGGRAAALNALFDEWRKARDGEPIKGLVRFGSVSWLFREFKASEAYGRRVSARTRPDYERLMQLVENQVTKKGDRIGDRPVKAVTPRAADRLYARIIEGPRGPRPRQGEKVIALCRHAWNVVHRLYPDQFNRDVPNPWAGVTKQQRTMATKPATTREQVYTFAWGAIDPGHPEAAAAAVICFEWLQRPENVLAGAAHVEDRRQAAGRTRAAIDVHLGRVPPRAA
jgi:hypothetical protein